MQYQLRATSVGIRETKSCLKNSWAFKRKTHHRYCQASPIAASGALYEVAAAGDILDVLFISGISLSIAVNIGVSALPLLVGPKDAMKLKQIREDDGQDIKWGVMSILTFFPLLNWLVKSHLPALMQDTCLVLCNYRDALPIFQSVTSLISSNGVTEQSWHKQDPAGLK